ncbi:ion channel [Cerasicoccus fimbriatus]|uniref:ion channel n=1 Tax=Cerasicoccus fimbriatus TaxID=3014554 RepID=UPI0022B57265|nr:ion channel [Cerasicoccus sp. TK19100]
MIAAIVLVIILIVFAIAFHYWALGALLKLLPDECGPNRHFLHAVGVLLLVMGIHVTIIFCFTIVFWSGTQYLNLGSLNVGGATSFMDYFYHSAVSYSTLGLSEVPEGHLKIMTAFESLAGIMLLTWSATFYYTVIGRNSKQ